MLCYMPKTLVKRIWALTRERIYIFWELQWSLPRTHSAAPLGNSEDLSFATHSIAHSKEQGTYTGGDLGKKNQLLRHLRKVPGTQVGGMLVFKLYLYFVILILYFIALIVLIDNFKVHLIQNIPNAYV